MGPICQGNTEKCLMHFRDAPFEGDKKTALVAFCQVRDVRTVRRWFVEKVKHDAYRPIGTTLVRLRYYLELLGYEVFELKKLPRPVYAAGCLFVFGLVDLETLATEFDMPKGDSGRSQLLAMFRGEQTPSTPRLKKIAAYVDKFKTLIDEARQQADRLHYRGEKPSGASRPAALIVQPIPTTATKSTGPMVGPLADLIKAMVPLARVVASKAYSAEDRNRLRELAGKGVIFEASNLLSSLCSETALGLNSAKNK